ncbi:Bug family tripartite tricarboxylate transporter substrate binding protein [Rubrivivax sp. RP6-9]|uniref:Bug family tripartite tricarboxylate transporter substrate binding protein n=1 Tax=Rubrivivax sp. RP6-9 TaxID=3415750 RepID=UPI003CC5A74F
MQTIVRSAAALLAGLTLAGAACAQAWPARPVKVVVAFTPGGTTDILARNIGQQLGDKLKQSFVIENKPGAGGNTGTEMVVRAPADGYTLIVNSVGPIAVNPTLYPKLAYNPLTDLVPIVQIADVPNVLVVHPSVTAKNFDEFVVYARANPGKLNCSSTGIGTSSHLSCFILAKRAGFEAVHVPYKGADALRDLLAGRVQFMFATIPSVKQHIDSGALRAIAVTSAKRSRSMPDVPTVAERGHPGFEAGSWFGFFAPKGTPAEVVATLNKAVNEILAVPAVEAALIKEGADPVGGTPQQFAQFTQREFEKWRAVVKDSGASAE